MKNTLEKMIAIVLCVLGVSSVAYGMAKERDGFFIAGLVLAVSGYLVIRRKLKENVRKTKG